MEQRKSVKSGATVKISDNGRRQIKRPCISGASSKRWLASGQVQCVFAVWTCLHIAIDVDTWESVDKL